MNYKQKETMEFAIRIKAMGFRVFVAEDGTYGFITDDKGERVLSFGFSDGGRLSGNYGPPSRESGTGFALQRMPEDLRTADDVRSALYASAPSFCGKGWRYYTKLEQYLIMYGSSSRYVELGDDPHTLMAQYAKLP